MKINTPKEREKEWKSTKEHDVFETLGNQRLHGQRGARSKLYLYKLHLVP